jgi:hypothetical protein
LSHVPSGLWHLPKNAAINFSTPACKHDFFKRHVWPDPANKSRALSGAYFLCILFVLMPAKRRRPLRQAPGPKSKPRGHGSGFQRGVFGRLTETAPPSGGGGGGGGKNAPPSPPRAMIKAGASPRLIFLFG